jgi:hypothetical protein
VRTNIERLRSSGKKFVERVVGLFKLPFCAQFCQRRFLQGGHFMQRLPSLFERVTDERSQVTFACFLQIGEGNVRAVTKDYTRATYPAWRQLMRYGEVAAKGKKSSSCPASNSGRTFAPAALNQA